MSWVVSATGSPASGSATLSPCWRKGSQSISLAWRSTLARAALSLRSRRKASLRSCFARTVTRAASRGQWVQGTSCYSHQKRRRTSLKRPLPGRAAPGPKWRGSCGSSDLQYMVALMASPVCKNPKVVKQIGHRLLNYLCQTANYCLGFGGREEPDLRLQVPGVTVQL